MITIYVLNFSLVKDALGQKNMEIKMNNGETVGCLLGKIRVMNKKKLDGLPIRAAVNQSYVDENCRLHNKDIVALIPPVSGG
jgi:molybdopterin converting factor small subunit|tara:strand:- start:76 stop:321 length:246 start_codon:yes stop_codon:yes gene_type:complete